MNFIRRWLTTKNDTPKQEIKDLEPVGANDVSVKSHTQQIVQVLTPLDEPCNVLCIGEDFMSMFYNIPEVYWPIDYIARRISECHFDIKKASDDSIVLCDRTGAGRIINRPNPLTTWRELVYQYFVYKFTTGNAFFRAAVSESLSDKTSLFRWCSNYWVLPADKIDIVPVNSFGKIPLFGVAELEDIIKGYRLNIGDYANCIIPPRQILHDKDGIPMRNGSQAYLKASSRLKSVVRNISNLIAVYEARNVIYRKRGALGFLVANKQDESGTIALKPDEKTTIRNELNKTYGVGEGQAPYGVTDVPMSFVHMNMSIKDLEPFEETLEDAIKIAAIFGIPSVLVPRKDQSTFSNQDSAEKCVYTSVIIPTAKRFCDDLTKFLGLNENGYYLDCDFSDVACLQSGLKEATEVRKLTNEVCLVQFNCGLITLNDWRAQIHESSLEGEIYNKVKFEMTSEELAKIDSIIKSGSSTNITFNRGWQNENNQHINQPSKDEVENGNSN